MDKSAIILADGSSARLNIDKAILELNGIALLNRVIDAVKGLVDEIIIVTNSEHCKTYKKLVSPEIKFAVDANVSKGPLFEAAKGFEVASGEYCLLLPANRPFVSKEVLSLLFDCCFGKSAAIPRFTNMEIEPLHAVYHTLNALDATKKCLEEGKVDMEAMVGKLRGVRYISTMVIEQLDPELKTFFYVNTPSDLRKIIATSKPKAAKRKN